MTSSQAPEQEPRNIHDTIQEAIYRFQRAVRNWERELWILVLIALVADFGLTVYGFQLGYVESNKLARFLLVTYGVAGILGLKLFVLVLAVSLRTLVPVEYRGIVPVSLVIPWGIAVVSNAILIASTI